MPPPDTSGLLLESQPAQERLETRIGAQRIQLWINLGEDNGIGTILVGLLEPIEGFIIFSQPRIDDRHVKCRNILFLCLRHQFSQNLLGFGPVSRSAKDMPQSSEHLRTVVRDGDGLLKLREGLWICVFCS